MEPKEFAARHLREGSLTDTGHPATAQSAAPTDSPSESGSRLRLWDRLKTAISSEHAAITAAGKPVKPVSDSSGLDHDRARQLLVAQRTSLLPAADANALSAHLLTCDPCYRFAQDLAARSRQL